jgi:hypothetical protein
MTVQAGQEMPVIVQLRRRRAPDCRSLLLLMALGLAGLSMALAAPVPSATIANGQLKATLYLPDANQGYYRATRFDWSGVVARLQYQGHDLVSPWFQATDPNILDLEYRGDQIVVGPGSAMFGYPEEFLSFPGKTAMGWQDAKVGGTVVKIGVGVLRKPDDRPYDHFRVYEIVDGGKWVIKRQHNSVSFTQTVNDASSGYGYVYTKRVSLTAGKPEMVLEHTLRNIGTKAIQGEVYEHNFTRWDNETPGPDYAMSFVFNPEVKEPLGDMPLAITARIATFTRTLAGRDAIRAVPAGFSTDAGDYDFRFENRKLGLGLHVTGNRPLAHFTIWAIRSAFAIEPFISLNIAPHSEFTWKLAYDAYQLPGPAP